VYVHLLDEVTARMTQERLVHATLMAGGKLKKGSELPDPDEAVKEFERKLNEPLQMEVHKARVLQLVRTI
jgi:hypothetical protein